MRPSISQLRGWNLSGLSDAASTARTNAQTLDTALDSTERAISSASQWFGKTHDAATTKVEQEVDHGREIRNVLDTIADDADDAARALGHARDFVIQKVDQAVAQGFTVNDTGQVTHPDEDKADEAESYQRSIQSGLDEVERVDNQYGTALKTAAKDLSSMTNGQPDITLPSGEKVDPDDLVQRLTGMSPDERSAFLATLSPEALHAMVIADPETLGLLNGVPFDARIAANEINIRNALFDEQQKQPPDQARVKQLEDMLKPMEDPLAERSPGSGPSDHLVDRKFVMFSTEGNGRMIEMIGELKPGVNGVGVIVPGTNTNLNGSGSNHNSAVNLARESGSPIFLYMENDFPQGLDKAADKSYAANMAPQLVAFGHEVDRAVAASAPGTPVTFVGHSYGGAIVGTAEQLGLNADRVVHASSAGTGIYTTDYTNPNPNVQRYSMTAPGDPISVVQGLPREVDTSRYPYLDYIPGIPHTSDGHIGNPLGGLPAATDPDKIPGVTRLDTGYYGPNGAHPNQVIVGPDGHGKYWDDPGSTAFDNIVGVISGGEVSGYVERGIETNNVDINVGDDGNVRAESWDIGKAFAGQATSGADLPGPLPKLPENDAWEHPWDNPRITDNPGTGPKIEVR